MGGGWCPTYSLLCRLESNRDLGQTNITCSYDRRQQIISILQEERGGVQPPCSPSLSPYGSISGTISETGRADCPHITFTAACSGQCAASCSRYAKCNRKEVKLIRLYSDTTGFVVQIKLEMHRHLLSERPPASHLPDEGLPTQRLLSDNCLFRPTPG